MRITRLDAEKRDLQRRLERTATTDDLAKDGTDCCFGKGAAAQLRKPIKNLLFAARDVNLFVVEPLLVSDFDGYGCPFV